MKTTSLVSVFALSLALSAGAGAFVPAVSQFAGVSAAQAAEKKPQLGRKVGVPLQEAQKLAQDKKWKEAMAKLKEADAVDGKNAYENFVIAQMTAFIARGMGDYGTMARALEEQLGSDFLDAGDKANTTKALAAIYYEQKSYAKSIEFGKKVLAANPGDSQMIEMVAQAYFIQKDFKNAASTMRTAINQAESAGRPVEKNNIELLMSAEFQAGNTEGTKQALVTLVQRYPSPTYWRDLLDMVQKSGGSKDDRTTLDIYRLRLATGSMDSADEYLEMAQLAIQLGLPGEARTVVEKGYAAGKLGNNERHNRLKTMASSQAATDEKSLGSGEKEAAGAATGEPLVKFGEAYVSYGKYAQGIALMEKGIAKGKIKNADEAVFHLGLAQLWSGDTAKASATFKRLTTSKYQELGKLWLIANKKA